jgi:hypothetical protein
VLSNFNYYALKLVTGGKFSSVTEFIARYQYGVISNRLKQPVTDRTLISNGLYELVTDRFNLCNGFYLTSVTKNSSLLPSVVPCALSKAVPSGG